VQSPPHSTAAPILPYELKVIPPAAPASLALAHLTPPSIPRLDRLLQLLDNGSSATIRAAAAKQIGQIAAKCITADLALEHSDININPSLDVKPVLPDVDRSKEWSAVMSVVARVRICRPQHRLPLNLLFCSFYPTFAPVTWKPAQLLQLLFNTFVNSCPLGPLLKRSRHTLYLPLYRNTLISPCSLSLKAETCFCPPPVKNSLNR
jgi:hypothetical protein